MRYTRNDCEGQAMHDEYEDKSLELGETIPALTDKELLARIYALEPTDTGLDGPEGQALLSEAEARNLDL